MSSKRKTPARTKTTKARSPLAAPVASAAPSAAPKDRGAVAPFAVEAPSPAAGRAASLKIAPPPVSREERHRMIASVAYGYAERAGFRNNPVEDWLRAEREVDARLERLAS
ncbi:DUF2934 domain-containing protein [Sorangium sp. So ce1036]|uniref:DUF2934 domain-containing protein n=1 Tax=Sorangium sp. So ce1036 TaxID=3133328 RepID=UPI003F0901A9